MEESNQLTNILRWMPRILEYAVLIKKRKKPFSGLKHLINALKIRPVTPQEIHYECYSYPELNDLQVLQTMKFVLNIANVGTLSIDELAELYFRDKVDYHEIPEGLELTEEQSDGEGCSWQSSYHFDMMLEVYDKMRTELIETYKSHLSKSLDLCTILDFKSKYN